MMLDSVTVEQSGKKGLCRSTQWSKSPYLFFGSTNLRHKTTEKDATKVQI